MNEICLQKIHMNFVDTYKDEEEADNMNKI